MRDRGSCTKTYRKMIGQHEHRRVMAQMIGRPLETMEVVHHIDGDKRNNDPSNLMLFASQSEHVKHHAKIRRETVGQKKCSVAGCGKPHKCRNLCNIHYQEWQRRQRGVPLKKKRNSCTTEHCSRPAVGRGLCSRHWQQWRATSRKEGTFMPLIARTIGGPGAG